jgi:hypothetical protein
MKAPEAEGWGRATLLTIAPEVAQVSTLRRPNRPERDGIQWRYRARGGHRQAARPDQRGEDGNCWRRPATAAGIRLAKSATKLASQQALTIDPAVAKQVPAAQG